MEEKQFIDRDEELNQLLSALKRKGPELVILYGRRRVGKSRLLREVSKKHNIDVSVMLEEADYATNLKKVSDAAAKRFNFPSFSPASFKDLFSSLSDGSIIVLDEYSYIYESAGEFQAVWEEIAKPKKIKLVLSGSFIRIMEDLNYSIKSPLYGRATEIIKLMPLSVIHVRKWYEGHKLNDVLNAYFCVGGIPRYLEIIKTPSLESIKDAFFSKNGLLLREGKLLLKESFPTSVLIPKILFSVASGVSEASKIANAVQIKANEISKYLSMLVDYSFVERKYPVIGGGKKDVRFYPADRFFAFWARFVWPNYSEIENGTNRAVIETFEKNFSTFSGPEFERVVIEIMQAVPDAVPFKFGAIGRQWGRIPEESKPDRSKNQYEIDIIAFNENTKDILFAECKWQDLRQREAEQVLSDLKEKSKYVDWNIGKRKEHFAIFARKIDGKDALRKSGFLAWDLDDH